ncbi:serine/threonine-protein kinase [Actinomadura scrupuli]|uniref:serine/threonine-protein kinase n=1 Tax=Actinomadura scrupuli TaxID=559629 RepID=UPI003D98A963
MSFESLSRRDPRRIGSYTLLARLGAGAMGRVYLGRSAAGRLVAVKTIRAEYAEEPDFRVRFAEEVGAARRVSGAFTAPVVGADADAEVPWLATSYVPAPSLERLVRECGPLPVPAVRWLAAGCAEALESIHEANLVHRDLKPSNVLVSLDGPRVIDFGVARAMERATLTATRQAVGTPAFMAPEQARDTRQVGPASDVFSLGSTLAFAATGHSPYRGRTVTDILVRLATEPPDLTGLPDELHAIVTACLRRDPAERPAPAELLAELAPVTHDDLGHELAHTLLPAPALALIEEWRRGPRPSEPGTEDRTLDSLTPTTGHDLEPPAPAPAASAPGLRGRAERLSRSSMARLRRSGRTLSVVGSIAAVAGLLVVCGVVAPSLKDPPKDPPKNSPSSQRPPPMAPPLGPPQGPPRGPASGASDRPTGNPRIEVNQPYGDGDTVFVLHGTGWTPGQRITVRLTGSRTSPDTPTVDQAGTFNYAVNQGHEFFPGRVPPGTHHAVVTPYGGGARVEVAFVVHP